MALSPINGKNRVKGVHEARVLRYLKPCVCSSAAVGACGLSKTKRHIGGCLLTAIGCGLLGPLGSYGELELAARLAYWALGVSFHWAGGLLIFDLLTRYAGARDWSPEWLVALAIAALLTAPGVAVVLLLQQVFGHDPTMLPVWGLALAVFGMSFVGALIAYLLIERPTWRADKAGAPSPATGFRHRLGPEHADADLLYLQAQDHYIRAVTSAGSAMILMRLRDAVAELSDQDGMQVHRSFWVAYSAISEFRRNEGRAVLALENGDEVPVGRTFLAALADRGFSPERRPGASPAKRLARR